MATAADIITAAFIKIGVEAPTTAQTASALISLNNMMSLLGADKFAPVVVSEGFSLEASDPGYTIGPGGQWDTVRPQGVISCFLRGSNGEDYPIRVMSGRTYNNMPNKYFPGQPTELYFLPEYPLAKIIFNTNPESSIDAYFEFEKSFVEFATTATSVTLPPEYKEALVYNLAVSLGEDWDRVVSKTLYAQSIRTREIIERLNASARVVPKARFGDFGTSINYPFSQGSNERIDGGVF
jgi:hypothetical protein